jgi:hypothetical protein
MSQVGMSADNEDQPQKQPGRQDEPQQRWHDRFWRRPIDTIHLLRAHIRRSESEQKGDYYTPWFSYVRSKIIPNWGNFLVGGLVLGIALYVLGAVGLFEAKYITVTAAVAAAFFACMQWLIYSKQCEIMRDQHNAMRDQHDAMREQIGLAKGQLEQVQRDQRPWIGQAASEIKPLEVGKQIEGAFPVKNTGKTPGAMTGWKIAVIVASPFDDPEQMANVHLENLPAMATVIAPDGGLRLVLNREDALKITEEHMEAFNRPDAGVYGNRFTLLIFVRLIYHDLAAPNVTCMTQSCYVYKTELNEFYQHNHYNYMT